MAIPTFKQLTTHIVYWRIAILVPIILVAGVLLFFQFSGFSKEITREELDEMLAPSESLAPRMLYYKGRKRDFDYFVRILPYLGSDQYHLDAAASPVEHPFPFTSDSDEWKLMRQTTGRKHRGR